MRPTLTAYVSRLFLGQLVLVGFGFVALLQVFDLLKNARDVVERHGDSIDSLSYYAALRLPGTVSFMLPLCVLVATLMTLNKLAQHNEIVALKAAGLSLYRLLMGFAPVAVALAAAHWLLSDQIAPAAHSALQKWDTQAAVASGEAGNRDREVWVRSGRSVFRAAIVRADGKEAIDVVLFQRDDDGNVTEQLNAREARYANGQWNLFDVVRTVWSTAGAPQQSHLERFVWEVDLAPRDLVELSADPNGLTLRALLDFAAASGLGQHPEHYYRTWAQERIATSVSGLVMILLAVSVAQTLARSHSGTANFAAGVGLGFLYLIANGVILTLGEAGTLPPWLAAWAPLLVFGCIGGAALVVREGV